MSGLEAFSMVCNVITVISFGLETVKLCHSINESGSSDPELVRYAQWIRENSEQLLTHQQSANTDAEKRLHDIASECLQCTKNIVKEVQHISPKKSGLFRAMISTVKTIRRKPHLDQLKSRLQALRNTMDTVVIGQILKECITSGEINQNNYGTLIRDQKAFNRIHEQRSQVVEVLIREFHDSIKTSIVTALGTIEAKIDVVETRNHERQSHEKLLQSLKYDGMNERKNSIPRKHKKTFEWIFEGLELEETSGSYSEHETLGKSDVIILVDDSDLAHEKRRRVHEANMAKRNQRGANLLGWLQGDSRDLYWISGKPGSGKSTLMKFIVTDKRTKTALRSWRHRPEIISHFLWKPGMHLQQNLQGLLCSLLYQILMEGPDIGAQLLHNDPGLRFKNRCDDWDSEDLKRILFETLRATDRSYFVVLDGLDELSKPHTGMGELFGLMDRLMAEDNVKLCVSSRPERVFEDRLSSGRLLRMQDLTFQDILNYILATLDDITLEVDDYMKGRIATEILKKSDGVFIWVHTVLQNVKHGINEFNETWHDVYDRITELPPDLMELYRDMWSRLGESSKKYVRQAALYFQLVRYGDFSLNTVACLAVASNDKMLDSFTGLDTLPQPLELVKSSFSVLFPVHNETNDIVTQKYKNAVTEPIDKRSLDDTYLAMSKWDQYGAQIRFTHRTAVDFLDSDEGIKLFGEYKQAEDDIFSRLFRAGVLLGCMPHDHDSGIRRNFSSFSGRYQLKQPLDGTARDLLDLFRRCEERILPFCDPPPGFSSHAFFIFSAAYFGFYDYVEETLQATEDDYDAMVDSALIGACSLPFNSNNDPSSVVTTSRHDLIHQCLESLPRSAADPSENMMNAWRCFLRHFLPRALGSTSLEEKTTIGNILEYFISAGVRPSQKYIMDISTDSRQWYISIPNPQEEFGFTSDDSVCWEESKLYLEVNDYFLLRVLSDRIHCTSKVIAQAASLAFMRPILGRNPCPTENKMEMFTCSLSEDKREVFEEWIFEGFVMWPPSENCFPDEVPSCLQVEELGVFQTVFDALEEIGYDLPEVNQNYLCWHDYDEFVP
ncbi:hypothetical protein GCG54_00001039 [Colletotrichum gloeosporioides]|uniref:Nephrocystin 3-like N-terminal domain-containing protein n=1 Tax=Colletotrichum gloeosporioides TaxID=474922 RepID=A0A8H4C9L8_COLGL|nr:uncharacterized protein GCG54_00001039 [Colletotrichum gloeosporioides]KAF3799931.1 hypothetical protein GCG54_00001039 [Colletotrichum gloeosporioides]